MSKAKIRLKRKYRKFRKTPLKGWSYSSLYARKIEYPKGLLIGGLWGNSASVYNPVRSLYFGNILPTYGRPSNT